MTNRQQRRHPEKVIEPTKIPVEEMLARERTPDDLDPRAKSTGHGKKTADKWNQ
jgi:hypothetical protein